MILRRATLAALVAAFAILPVRTSVFAGETAAIRRPPIRLRYVPTGAGIIIHLRPAQLWREDRRSLELRECLGPLTEWAEARIKHLCGYEPQKIEEALICVIFGPLDSPPDITAVFRLVEGENSKSLVDRLQLKRVVKSNRTVYRDAENVYLFPDDATVAIIPGELADEILEKEEMLEDEGENEGLAIAGIDELLPASDRRRHLTLMFRPDDVSAHMKFLIPQSEHLRVKGILDWFGPEIESVAWSLDFGSDFSSDVRLRVRPSYQDRALKPSKVSLQMKDKLGALPRTVLEAVKKTNPRGKGTRRIVGRFPAMIKAVTVATRFETKRRFVHLVTLLPERAAPNLGLGARLVWNELAKTTSDKGGQTPSSSHESKLPKTIAGRLKQPIEIDFRRTPLVDAFAYIGDETQVRFEIDGNGLKLAGYTKNMPQTFRLGKVTASVALTKILKQYEEMVLVVDEGKKVVTVTTKSAAEAQGLQPFPLPLKTSR